MSHHESQSGEGLERTDDPVAGVQAEGGAVGAGAAVTSEGEGDPGVVLLKERRDILVACGIRVDEEPNFPLNLSIERKPSTSPDGSSAAGTVMIPLNYYDYLRKVDEMAKKSGVKFHVWMAGANRLVRQYGVDVSAKILAEQGEPAQQQYLKRLLKLEKIRAEVSRAVAEILVLDRFKGTISPLQMMKDDSGYRESILSEVTKLMEDTKNDGLVIPFLPEQGTSRLVFEDALRKSLPGHLRDDDYKQEELRYPATEAVIVRKFIESGLRYISPGTDDKPIEGRQNVSIATCLREAVCRRWERIEGRAEIYDELTKHWDVDYGLGGLASNISTGEPRLVDPYYRGNRDTSPDPLEKKPRHRRILANPWANGLPRRILLDTLGNAGPQTRQVLSRVVNPLLRHYLGVAFEKVPLQTEALLRSQFGHSTDDVLAWYTNTKLLVPTGIDFGAYIDLVRGMCEAVGARARAQLLKDDIIKE